MKNMSRCFLTYNEDVKDLIRAASAPAFFSFLYRKSSSFVRFLCPDTISIDDFGIFSHFARYLIHILLAAPSTGGAVSLILMAWLCSPAIMFFEDRG